MKKYTHQKKLLSLLIVSVLVIGGLSALGTSVRGQDEGEPVETINLRVTLSMEAAAGLVVDGDIDLFMHSIDGPVYQGLPPEWRREMDTWTVLGSYNSWLLNPAREGHGTSQMQEAVDEGWVEEPEDVRWLANDATGDWTINPFAHNDIRFAMQYFNREAAVEDLQDGFADPRYGPMAISLEIWEQYFIEGIEERYDITAEGDEARMEWIIEQAMLEIQEEVAFGEVTGSIEDGWYYEHPESDTSRHQIRINIIARIEDWREELGHWTADILEEFGFDVSVRAIDSASAIPAAFFGDPEPYDNLDYHIYTGGWVSTTAVFYQEAAFNQMHAPWYGFMQTYGLDEHYQYDDEGYDDFIGPSQRVRDQYGISDEHADSTVADFDQRGIDLFTGKIVDEDMYWEEKIAVAQMGFEESLRIFILTEQSFYPYNPEQLITSVPETINGYDTYFGPRTMRTNDGSFDGAILTGEDRPYMDNWNLYGGSADVYGEYQRRMAREWGSWPHPQTGLPMQVNVYWESELSDAARTDPYERHGEIETDFDWVEDDEGELELEENIEIPEDALDWIPGEQQWMNRDQLIAGGYIEDEFAAVKATLDVHDLHVWHDGTEFSIEHHMASYARSKELGDDTYAPYLPAHDALNSPWWGSIHAINWDEEHGTYTVWGDYTFPMDAKIGNYYATFPEVHPLTYEGWDHLHGQTEVFEESGIDQTYHYETGVADNWIHQISPAHTQDLITILGTMQDMEYLPVYLEDAPVEYDWDQVNAELSSLIDFMETYDHTYVGCGPFVIEEYSIDDHSMRLEQWENYGFALPGEEVNGVEFPFGYWAEQFEIDEIRLTEITTPIAVETGQLIDVSGRGEYAGLYPTPTIRAIQSEDLDDYRFTLRDDIGGEILIELGSADVDMTPNADTSFEATFDGTDTEGMDGGHYTVQLEALPEGDVTYVTISDTVILYDPAVQLEAEDWIFPAAIDEGETGTIGATVTNHGEEEDTAVFTLVDEDDEMEWIHNETVGAGDTEEISFDYTFEEMGRYELELRDDEDRFVDFAGEIVVRGIDISLVGLTVEPTFGAHPLEVTIEMLAVNDGQLPGEATLEITDEAEDVVESWTYEIADLQSISPEETYTFEPGDYHTYNVTFGSEFDIDDRLWVEVNVTILEATELEVPEEVIIGDEETVTVDLTNTGDVATTAYLYADDEEIASEDLDAEEEGTIETEYEFDEAGTVDFEVRDARGDILMADTTTVLDLFDLTVDIEGEGTVTVDWEDYEGVEHTETVEDTWTEEDFVETTEVTLTAEAAENWAFHNWTGDHESEEEEITIGMDDDKTLTATFTEPDEWYELSIELGEGEGTAEVDGDEVELPYSEEYPWFEDEEPREVTLLASAADGYEFDSWEGDYPEGESDSTIIDVVMDEDKSLTVNFIEEVVEYQLTINIDGEGTVEVDGVEWGDGDSDTFEEGTEVVLEAIPDDDWEFEEWTGDYEGEDAEITITMDEDKSITAVFEEDTPGIPGFTFGLLVLGAVVAVAIYYKKEQ